MRVMTVRFSLIFLSTLWSRHYFPLICSIFISQYHQFSEKVCCLSFQKSQYFHKIVKSDSVLFQMFFFNPLNLILLVLTKCLSRELWISILSLIFVLILLSFLSFTYIDAFFVFKAIFKNTLSRAGPVTVSVPFLQAGSTSLIHSPGKGFKHHAALLTPQPGLDMPSPLSLATGCQRPTCKT